MKLQFAKLVVLIALAFGLRAIGLAQQAQPAKQPAAPAVTPNPEWVHEKLGVVVYPAQKQVADQQQKDETECYTWARSKTGIDPTAPPTPPAPVAQPAGDPGKGARASGAARGAAGGAAIGAVTGDAGRGAAVGATVGTIRGGAQKRKAKRAAEQQQQAAQSQAEQQAAAADQQKIATFKKAYSACLQGRGYTVQ